MPLVSASSSTNAPLCEEKSTEVAVTNVKHTDLTQALSNSLEKKATLLDIQASLSLEVLGGLVKAEGSASYLNDAKCNKERRLLFAEKEMATNVLDMVRKDYIALRRCRMKRVSKENSGWNSISSKGRSFNAKADAKIKAQFEATINFQVHGDVELESIPVKPADVLDVIPQPIPKTILDDAQVTVSVYGIRQSLINEALETFAQLEDVRNRFRVLRDMMTKGKLDMTMSSYDTSNPKSGQGNQRAVNAKSTEDREEQLTDLGFEEFKDEQFTGFESKPKEGNVYRSSFMPSGKDHSMLDQARYLYQAHTPVSHQTLAKDSNQGQDRNIAPAQVTGMQAVGGYDGQLSFETPLVFLERALLDFQHFVHDIRDIPAGQAVNGKVPPSNLSTFADVSRAPRYHTTIHSFLMTSLEPPDANFAVLRFLALLRKYKDVDSDSRYLLYVEDPSELKTKLPAGKDLSLLTSPSYYVGSVDDKGVLSWKLISPKT
ncbi:hypothetical protein BKA82DRAFT_35042 [Pisolithus tinctorius]|nr:hypothetical protein BKA82DRAFT_35042 [Pisolithus tinctorius]